MSVLAISVALLYIVCHCPVLPSLMHIPTLSCHGHLGAGQQDGPTAAAQDGTGAVSQHSTEVVRMYVCICVWVCVCLFVSMYVSMVYVCM